MINPSVHIHSIHDKGVVCFQECQDTKHEHTVQVLACVWSFA